MQSSLKASPLGSWGYTGAVKWREPAAGGGEQIWEEDDEIPVDGTEFKTYETFKWACPEDN